MLGPANESISARSSVWLAWDSETPSYRSPYALYPLLFTLPLTAGRAWEFNSADGRGCARKRAIASEHGAEGGEVAGGWWSNEAQLRYGREVAELP